MKNRHRRLKTIELTLTPYQTVLLWLTNAVNGTFGDDMYSSPRSVIANSILKTVTNALKGESDAVVERAILQGRQEADLLFNLVIDVNVGSLQVLQSATASAYSCSNIFEE